MLDQCQDVQAVTGTVGNEAKLAISDAPPTTVGAGQGTEVQATPTGEQEVVYRNCTQVRQAGAAPIRRGEPGFSDRLDRDGDGVACE